ncbi:hypothetical protein SYNPS1DRAFT_26895 [Syncephalis pseudoplumigaleata]|uniref:Uncharacterized protein n=1 Tax=Syncephalis pseudoplumigaleata TaxID=1712513 RepID=A0A4P9Z6H5_9FUNG|nr:hypothetical protein SYNPS1DRAFT_26895 [Syncephalis pseudoplumigaleata]|eukprot:RKP27451.1 hypothetical protein SYNPS1DRAFT_26895 [Syncephalis pseudoplumigaleata]
MRVEEYRMHYRPADDDPRGPMQYASPSYSVPYEHAPRYYGTDVVDDGHHASAMRRGTSTAMPVHHTRTEPPVEASASYHHHQQQRHSYASPSAHADRSGSRHTRRPSPSPSPPPPTLKYWEQPAGMMVDMVAQARYLYEPISVADVTRMRVPRPLDAAELEGHPELKAAVDAYYEGLPADENDMAARLGDTSTTQVRLNRDGWEKGYLDFWYDSAALQKRRARTASRRYARNRSYSRSRSRSRHRTSRRSESSGSESSDHHARHSHDRDGRRGRTTTQFHYSYGEARKRSRSRSASMERRRTRVHK